MITLVNRSSGYILRFESVAGAIRHSLNVPGDWYLTRIVRG
jgi:hypothetical protein